ncbi:hypothetical protein RhiirA5_424587 [Rhizophagus irregularis]|uniref:F-box domain-containing protein n=3 Tax=Rhizophagus irregularis TaxID=588596 RepID=A0A015KBQ2_RHIIW|nr:hypothetical protein RirG_244060 [Rhizophagus irregularis DAOM 197198w]EXX79187.1 hypothetical protein RirG_008070 [Rhizophagus irregularis DAOM 197198w]PKC02895.1 hypothetical protein RhiirA5_424587 [Rhizophagus irregularis]UZO05290.1 hypothetical protein OCT59_025647 [Rhizophagus irregularis]GBC11209.1 hypothetical protein GLOIN_2v1493548 [Rhizophagus irregularis DAOM 181602=DAOM 197198]
MEKLNIDCFILIFNELQADKKSLYSCLLVNKEWYHLVVPILWGNYPYFNCEKSKEKYSNIILSCLPTSSKQLLFDNNIKLSSAILSNTLTFNYVSFCKFHRTGIIDNIIKVVFKENLSIVDYSKKRNLLEQEIYKLFISQCEGIKELDWRTSQPLPSFPGAITFFSQLYSLYIDLYYVDSHNLYQMAQICKDLNALYVRNFIQDIPGLISLINAQRNLKIISFDFNIKKGTCEGLSEALARKGCTINELSLFGSVGIIPHSFLTSLINLKDLTIYYDCENYGGIKEFQKCLANSEFPNLQFLEIDDGSLCFKELAMLIEKTKGNITYISVYMSNRSADNTGMLLKAISNHCPNIENLTTYIGSDDLIYVKSLLMDCNNLMSLCLNSFNENNDMGDELLNILIRFSPKYLTDITISGNLEYSISAFINFFESYRERKPLCFYINDNGEHITTGHVDVVNKYYGERIITSSNLLVYDHFNFAYN